MKTITLLPANDKTVALIRALHGIAPEQDIEQCRSFGQMLRRLASPIETDVIAVIAIESQDMMARLRRLGLINDRYRLVLIIDTSDQSLVEQAHLLRPRVVVDDDVAAMQVPRIVRHIQAASTARSCSVSNGRDAPFPRMKKRVWENHRSSN